MAVAARAARRGDLERPSVRVRGGQKERSDRNKLNKCVGHSRPAEQFIPQGVLLPDSANGNRLQPRGLRSADAARYLGIRPTHSTSRRGRHRTQPASLVWRETALDAVLDGARQSANDNGVGYAPRPFDWKRAGRNTRSLGKLRLKSADATVANTVAIFPKVKKNEVKSIRLTRHPFRQNTSKISYLDL
jgi:hypothetical protein